MVLEQELVLHKKSFQELTVDELYELLRVRSEMFVVAMLSSKEFVCAGAPLCAITFLKYCWAPLMSGCMVTLPAPADSPQIVTLSGSSPKAAIFSCTHFKAMLWSRSPRFCASG